MKNLILCTLLPCLRHSQSVWSAQPALLLLSCPFLWFRTLTLCPEIKKIKADLISLGASGVLMTGSGPTVFGLFETKEASFHAAEYFCAHGYPTCFASVVLSVFVVSYEDITWETPLTSITITSLFSLPSVALYEHLELSPDTSHPDTEAALAAVTAQDRQMLAASLGNRELL